MKVIVYPGSFNPFHLGHRDTISKVDLIFDKIIVAVGRNPDKEQTDRQLREVIDNIAKETSMFPNVVVTSFDTLLPKFIESLREEGNDVVAVLRGLRNGQDFESEKNQQYHYEDLGLTVPILYVVSDRKMCHISSSAVRAINKFRK